MHPRMLNYFIPIHLARFTFVAIVYKQRGCVERSIDISFIRKGILIQAAD